MFFYNIEVVFNKIKDFFFCFEFLGNENEVFVVIKMGFVDLKLRIVIGLLIYICGRIFVKRIVFKIVMCRK